MYTVYTLCTVYTYGYICCKPAVWKKVLGHAADRREYGVQQSITYTITDSIITCALFTQQQQAAERVLSIIHTQYNFFKKMCRHNKTWFYCKRDHYTEYKS